MVTDYSLYLVADADYAAGRDLAGLVDAAIEGGVTTVQLRANRLYLASQYGGTRTHLFPARFLPPVRPGRRP